MKSSGWVYSLCDDLPTSVQVQRRKSPDGVFWFTFGVFWFTLESFYSLCYDLPHRTRANKPKLSWSRLLISSRFAVAPPAGAWRNVPSPTKRFKPVWLRPLIFLPLQLWLVLQVVGFWYLYNWDREPLLPALYTAGIIISTLYDDVCMYYTYIQHHIHHVYDGLTYTSCIWWPDLYIMYMMAWHIHDVYDGLTYTLCLVLPNPSVFKVGH